MQKIIRMIITITISVLIMLTSTELVFADYTSAEEVFQVYGYGMEFHNKKVTKFLSDEFNESKGYTVSVTINGNNYWYNPEDEAEIIDLGNILDKKVRYSKNNKDSLRAFNDATDDQTIQADTSKGLYIVEGFVSAVSTVLGVIVVLISVGVTVSTAIDIVYMVNPIAQQNLDKLGSKKDKDGDNRIVLVTDDAVFAVEQALSASDYVNPLIIYFKSRILTYMILAILLFILITGKITAISQLALKLVSGIINILAQMG